MSWGITIRFQKLSLSQRQVAHVLLTRPPLRIKTNPYSPFDLHVLSVPPAFVLSQDQTLYKSCISISLSCIEIYPVHNACVITAFFSLVLTFSLLPNLLGQKGISRVVTFSCIVWFSRCCVRSLLWDSFNIISHLFEFVKYFFQVFSNSFYVTAAPFCWAAFLLYHISFCLSSTFSTFFKQFFLWYPLLSEQL